MQRRQVCSATPADNELRLRMIARFVEAQASEVLK